MKSTPQGWCRPGGRETSRVDGFFSPSIKLDRPEGIPEILRKKNLGGSRLVTSGHVFFCFPPSFEHFSGLLEKITDHVPQKRSSE